MMIGVMIISYRYLAASMPRNDKLLTYMRLNRIIKTPPIVRRSVSHKFNNFGGTNPTIPVDSVKYEVIGINKAIFQNTTSLDH